MTLHTGPRRVISHSFALIAALLLPIGLTSCFDSSTEEAPSSLKQPPPAAKPKPSAVNDTLSVPLQTQGVVSVLDNDTAPNGGSVTIDGFDETTPHNGIVTDNGDGTFTYTPDPSYEGTDSFTYTIKGPDGSTATATVTIIVSADVIPNGEAFYANNCAICHAAGSADTSTAFNATDLALRANPLDNDITIYNGPYALMGTYNDVAQQNIDELKAYIATLSP